MSDELTFEDMLELQREFELNFFDPDDMTMDERADWLESFSMHVIDQSTGLLNELNWKEHERATPVEYDDVTKELVDIFKYFLAMCCVLNVDPIEFRETFVDRSKEVERRYEREMS